VAGEEVARPGDDGTALVRIGPTLKLKANQVGITGDGWMGARAAYNRFDVSQDGDSSIAVVRLNRETFCPLGVELPGLITAKIGPLGVSATKEPKLASVTATDTVYVPGCGSRAIAFNTPPGPWRIELEADTFRPSEVDPEHTSDARDLGARVSFEVIPQG
jgi:hypothetical protein